MILEIDDWTFDIDITATMEYSAAEAQKHCDCAYCRNFYAAVDDTYPNLRSFLAQFGLDIEAPDELMPYTSTLVSNLYAVSGRIIKASKNAVEVNGVVVTPRTSEWAKINTDCPKPYFVLEVGILELPWVLNEPMLDTEIVSPANQPSFLKRMWDKFLNRQLSDEIKS